MSKMTRRTGEEIPTVATKCKFLNHSGSKISPTYPKGDFEK